MAKAKLILVTNTVVFLKCPPPPPCAPPSHQTCNVEYATIRRGTRLEGWGRPQPLDEKPKFSQVALVELWKCAKVLKWSMSVEN